MNKYYKIKHNAIKGKFPFLGFITLWLLLDRINAPEVIFGVLYGLVGIAIIAWVIVFATDSEIDVDIQDLLKKHCQETGQEKQKTNSL